MINDIHLVIAKCELQRERERGKEEECLQNVIQRFLECIIDLSQHMRTMNMYFISGYEFPSCSNLKLYSLFIYLK